MDLPLSLAFVHLRSEGAQMLAVEEEQSIEEH
jgi:hypothetical protein